MNSESQSASPNRALLDEVNRARTWFHARKTRPIWAKPIEQDRTVETREGDTRALAGDFLCRGEAGDTWPMRAKDLHTRYNSTDEADAQGWRKYVPRPDAQGVMAAQVPHPFQVQTSWGLLSGSAGDYVVKNYRDRDVAYPDDVWIVAQHLFRATYEALAA